MAVVQVSLTPDEEKRLARQGRFVALVIIGVMLLWMALQWIGATVGLETRFMFLVDFFALAGFLWAFIVTFQIWRKRRNNQG